MHARPATAQEAARRALGLCGLVCRQALENGPGQAQATEMHALVLHWLDRSGALQALDSNEIKIMAAPLGSLERTDCALSFWRHEQLSVLAWALGKVPAPSISERYSETWLARRVGFLRQDTDDIIHAATIRPPAELAMYAAYVDESAEALQRLQRTKPGDDVRAALVAAHERSQALEWLLGQRALELEAPLLA